ncbi:hypothetical protein AWM79_15850 [Pseudomonas agarici]|uniref:4-hydroxybenzoyl-CoA thioesterase n=1 Tax=Pseudomonas agarici TaxID=46677 RepID=A0A0X1T3P2_PSEAA|nr:thioesterase family protein [Pseudomonas agarici]AMB86695.1 hypothetical protein AWM79_15850 [Pseudomonas agarici]
MNYFDYEYTITMGDTNAMGNFYFLNYFKLQGVARELWLKVQANDFLVNHGANYIFSTKSAHCDFSIPFFLYDDIIVRLHFSELRRLSVKLNFQFFLKGRDEIHASGWQVVVFKNKDRKTCRIPPAFSDACQRFM